MVPNKGDNPIPPTSQVRAHKKPTPSTTAKTRTKHKPSEITLLGEQDLFFFNAGTHFSLHEKLGAHLLNADGEEGTYFAVWAPDAEYVSVMGEFNGWEKTSHPLYPKGQSGIWERFFLGIGKGTIYKYHIVSRFSGYRVDKMDPFAIYTETPPKTASVVWDLVYEWGDQEWMEKRRQRNALDAPMAIYEVHLGSWRRVPEEDNRPLTYRELAQYLPEYVQKLGFTHVEFLPLCEHP